MSSNARTIRFPLAQDLPDTLRLIGCKERLQGDLAYYGTEMQDGRTYHIYKHQHTGELVAFPEELEEAL